jgi:DNA-binding SARP family transcriptional activator/tetratricopeptide (TPR) repeat protein
MRVRVLGPVQLCIGDAVVEVGPPQRCVVFAALAADAGRVVTPETLIARVWGQQPPRGARRTIHTHIACIRGVLARVDAAKRGSTAVVRRRAGYVLDVDQDVVDVHRLRRLATQASDTGCTADDRMALWREAVGLWRGEPLAGLGGDWVERTREAWFGQYRDAVLGWAYAEIRAGDPTQVIDPLTQLLERYPLVEALPAMVMRSLYAAGRRTEALEHYAAASRRLEEELAEPPGAELQAVYLAVLRREPELPPPVGAQPAGTAVPAQLPADVRGFAGRADELAQLDAIATNVGDGATPGGEATAVVISAIAGTAGVGKTALAVHWAHRAAKRFPDGQLYVNLRGFDPTGAVLDPADAIRGFLDALGTPPKRIPDDREAQASLYRTRLADKRMLIVLDNARDTAQVRPVLPGAPRCLVLVTSRSRLSSLVAATGAYPLPLDLLTHQEAHELLTRRLGAGRVAAEPGAADELITRCARLPLALAIVAAHAATQPHLPLAALAAELHDVGSRLDVLADADPATDPRAVFSWSYAALTPAAARQFRLLGLHPGPDISAPAAGSLAGLPVLQTRPLLAELTNAHLIVEHSPGRYILHDLLRAYAADLTRHTDPTDERRAATHRVLDHYLHTSYVANRLLNPTRDPITPAAAQPGTAPEHPSDHRQALEWFATEHRVLLAAVNCAATAGFPVHTWQIAWTLITYLELRGHWYDQIAIQHAAVAAAERLSDPAVQALTHRLLARAHTHLGHYGDAQIHLMQALDQSRQADDRISQAHTHHTVATLLERLGRHTEALEHTQRALDLYSAVNHQIGRARALNGIGWQHALLGNHQQALSYCRQALTLIQELGDRDAQAATWDSLGYIHLRLGHHRRAITCYHRAVDLYRDLGDHYDLADTLTSLGDTHHTLGNAAAARTVWQDALAILDDLHHPAADQLRTKLRDSNQSDP